MEKILNTFCGFTSLFSLFARLFNSTYFLKLILTFAGKFRSSALKNVTSILYDNDHCVMMGFFLISGNILSVVYSTSLTQKSSACKLSLASLFHTPHTKAKNALAEAKSFFFSSIFVIAFKLRSIFTAHGPQRAEGLSISSFFSGLSFD